VSYIQLAGILYATCNYNINTYILFRTLFRQSYRKDLSIRLNSAVALSFKSMFTLNTYQKVLPITIGALLLLSSSMYFPAHAQSVIKTLSVDDPAGVVLDLKGNAYIVETGKDRILQFSSNGTLIRTWGSSGSGPGQFNSPIGITLDYTRGYVYVTDTGNDRVQKFTSDGKFVAMWGSSGSGPGQFQTPIGIDEDESKQNVYVTDVGNNRVERFSSNGLFAGQWGSLGSDNSQFANPGRVAVDPAGNVFVADFGNNRIQKFDENGKFLMTWGSLGSGNGQFYNPTGMTVAFPQGNVYVADTGNSRIQEFSNDGKFINKWSINTPTGAIDNIDIDVNSKGIIYLADRAADQVLVISP
jgi:DNA-binding beta-propeller fold protein YncE